MESLDRCLERDGSKTIELDGLRSVEFDHLWAYIDGQNEIVMQVDYYHPDPAESWDSEEWEDASCYLSGKANRENWNLLFRIGRSLARHGKTTVHQPLKEPMTIACDGSIVTIQ